MPDVLKTVVTRVCQSLRQMVGIPDYDGYVRHMQSAHPLEPCMSYEEFFRNRQLTRYEGGRGGRCC
jgi:uncharacterized short protein YbdD (DUF466 family)